MKRDALVFIVLFFSLPIHSANTSFNHHFHQIVSLSKSSKKPSPLGQYSYTAKELWNINRKKILDNYLSRHLKNKKTEQSIKNSMEKDQKVIEDFFQVVTCRIQLRKNNAQDKHIFNNQQRKITSPHKELNGALGSILRIFSTLNQSTKEVLWICRCKAKDNYLELYSPLNEAQTITLKVPTEKEFDITLEKKHKDNTSEYYLTVYELPDDSPPSEEDDLVTFLRDL